jgi:hypothetical protein
VPDPSPAAEREAPSGDSEPSLGTRPIVDPTTFGPYYFAHDCGRPYERSEHWLDFFGNVAEHIVSDLRPSTVLDAGCAIGLLVEQLRNRGVEAYGVDISDYALSQVPDQVREHCWRGSLVEPLPRRYDLITCIEVVEHMPAPVSSRALANLCASTDRILLSSSPRDHGEPTHVNVHPPEHWTALLAHHGLVRDLEYDASFITPWAALYVRGDTSPQALARFYDRSWLRLRTEARETRAKLLELQARLEGLVSTSNGSGTSPIDRDTEVERLRQERRKLQVEILRLRDLVVGKEAELGSALGEVAKLRALVMRYEGLSQRYEEVVHSTSWRLVWALGAPLRKLRGHRSE